MKFHGIWVFPLLLGTVAARPFADVNGKIIEAEFVKLEGGNVTITKDGKAFVVPLQRLSKPDQAFVMEESSKPSAAPSAPAAGGTFELAGTRIQADGKMQVVEAPLTEETLKKCRKEKEFKSLKIAIALPKTFDPAVPQKFLWISAAINSDLERQGGNLRAFPVYTGTALAAGWGVVAVDCNTGNPRGMDNSGNSDADVAVHRQAVEMLSAAWPIFRQSVFACAGFSGGAKTSFHRVAQLATFDLDVVGLFLGGCNEDMTEPAKAETGVSSSALRKVKVWVSNGTVDKIASVDQGKKVGESADKSFGEVRIETYDGNHSLSREQLASALEWFLVPGKAPRK